MTLTEEEKQSKILAFETGKYKLVRQEFRYNWEEGRSAAQKAGNDLNEMVKLIHDEYPDWGFNRIAKKIWIDNEDLEGFSRSTIKRYLDESNLQLLGLVDNSTGEEKIKDIEDSSGTKGVQGGHLLSHNNDTEQSSSSSSTTPAAGAPTTTAPPEPAEPTTEEEEDEEEEESDQVKELKQQIQDSKKTNLELEEKLEQLTIQKKETIGNKFDFVYDLEITNEMLRQIRNNGRIMPLIATAYPDKKSGYVRFDNARLKETTKNKIILNQ